MHSIEETKKGTEMRIRLQRFKVRIEVCGGIGQRERRALLLSIFNKIDELFPVLGPGDTEHPFGWIVHWDGSWENLFRDQERGLKLRQALKVQTEEQKAGYGIRIARLRLRVSQAYLAHSVGLCRSHVSKIERGHVRARRETYEKIWDYLRVKSDKATIDQGNVLFFKRPRCPKKPVFPSDPEWEPPIPA